MNAEKIIDILNELLTLEQRRLVTRLDHQTVFVPQSSVKDHSLISRMADEVSEHGAWLADLITELGGVPGLRSGDITSADLHYQDYQRVLPRVLADQKSVIDTYALASDRVAGEPHVHEVVGRILARHRADLDELERIVGCSCSD